MTDHIMLQEDMDVLLKIQNSRKPDQVIDLVLDESKGFFRTRGLKEQFGLKEIRIESHDVLESMQEVAMVLSHILETISAGQDLRLPYMYQNEFAFKGSRYSMYEMGDFRVLRRL